MTPNINRIETMIETYSDDELKLTMEQLKRAEYLGKWGKDRLAELESEARRRRLNRRDCRP